MDNTVLCVRWGDKYDDTYVKKLKELLDRHLTAPFNFYCLTDNPKEKYDIPVPPVQVRFDECIGCQLCAKACTALTWDAIRMIKTDEFEETYDFKIN